MDAHSDQIALQNCYLFSSLTDESLQSLAKVSVVSSYAKHHQIFAMGDDADGLRIILSGAVRVWISDREGHELTVALLEAGDSLGEIALFDDLPRTAAATATAATQCLFITRSAANDLLLHNPEFAREIIQRLCEMLRRNTDEMGLITFSSLEQRLAQKLCDLAMSHAVLEGDTARFTSKFSQADLARMLGVSREAINKRMTALTKSGQIEVQDGVLKILSLKRLSSRRE